VFIAIVVGGLSVATFQEGRGAAVDVARTDGQVRALELAELGLAKAHIEVISLVDAAGDGVGNMSGSFAGGTWTTTATNSGNEWTLVSTGRTPTGVRRIEQRVRRIEVSSFGAGVFTDGTLTMKGGAQTDTYDSRLGDYASQAVNTDAHGTYAMVGGNIGSNSNIVLNGTSVYVRGDATPGPTSSVTIAGGASVQGSTTPAAETEVLTPTPISEFQAAFATNNNGNWTITGGTVTYDATKKDFRAAAGAVVTFPGGTYFFANFVLTGGATARFTGPTKIYVTNTFDTSGGGTVNESHNAEDLLIYAHPYAIPKAVPKAGTQVSINGGADAYMGIYAPAASFSIGSGDLFGAVVAKTATLGGNAFVHYDVRIGHGGANAILEGLYWVERNPPIR
jgi:hypothetical protein